MDTGVVPLRRTEAGADDPPEAQGRPSILGSSVGYARNGDRSLAGCQDQEVVRLLHARPESDDGALCRRPFEQIANLGGLADVFGLRLRLRFQVVQDLESAKVERVPVEGMDQAKGDGMGAHFEPPARINVGECHFRLRESAHDADAEDVG